VQTFRKRRAGLSATAGLSCLLTYHTRESAERITDEQNEERGKDGVEATCNHVCDATSDQRNSVADA